MLRNAGTLSAGERLSTDVCIIGSGPAGLTLARELAGADFRVLVLESGGFRARHKLRALNEGETDGETYYNPRNLRERQVGGAANRWLIELGDGRRAARYAPFSAIDLAVRDGRPGSGWPLSRLDLDPFYARAHEHCGLGPFDYDLARWLGPSPDVINTSALETRLFQFGAQDRWTRGNAALFQHNPNVDLLIEATAVEIVCARDSGCATGVRFIDGHGRSHAAEARHVVVAVGCFETVRLLLNSRGLHAQGLGNGRDVVGRYFMDHPQSYLNVLVPDSPRLFDNMGAFDLQPRGAVP